MKISLFLIVFYFFTGIINVKAVDKFEGKIYYHLNVEGKETDLNIITKGQKTKAKFKFNGIDISIIINHDDKKMYTIMESQKIAVTTELKETKQVELKANALVKTGVIKNICGTECQQIFYTKETGTKVEIWLANNMGNDKFIKNGLKMNDIEIVNAGILDLKSQYVRLTATKVEKVSINDLEFGIPKNFTVMEAPLGLAQGLGSLFGQ